MNQNLLKFIEKVQLNTESKELIKLQLTSPKEKSSDLKKMIISAVELKKGYRLSFVYRYTNKDITQNYEIPEGLQRIARAIDTDFNNAEAFFVTEKIHLYTLPGGKIQLKATPTEVKENLPDLTHNRVKDKLISLQENVYLRELGISNVNFGLRREMSDKFRQINKYIELLSPYLKELNLPDNFHVADMGSGKGYLTFALYDYLTGQLGFKPTMSGVEFRQDLVDTCNRIAELSKFENLNFVKGTIADTKLPRIDVLIALHACNTATDDAIFRGIQSNASLIVCAPCCHKQIRQAMNVNNELSSITRFGILKERQAEMLTDTIRALLMEACGYKTNVIEFIPLEHTPKNVMIIGHKTRDFNPDKEKIMAQVSALKQMFGIDKHYLETLLNLQ